MSDASADTLVESYSPNGNLWAFVEDHPDVLHFYLHGRPETGFGVKSVWVRNLKPAPVGFDTAAMKRGEPPMMPAATCAHPNGLPRPDAARLRIVWFEEGDAAALFEGDEMLAAIPCWSGLNGFHGYARDCTSETPLAWPLKDATAIFERVARAEDFWQSWDGGWAHWPQVQDAFMSAYERVLGPHKKYWGIDRGEWPPKAIAMFEQGDAVVFLTLGVSIRPMPKVEMTFEDPAPHRRMELGLGIDRSLATPEVVTQCVQYLSAQSNLPWTYYSWLGEGHTVQCDPSPVGGDFSAMVLSTRPSGAPEISMPSYCGDPVNLLWMTPITPAESKLAQDENSGVLLSRLATCGPLWPHLRRVSSD
jgi:hypothetical protein